MSTTKNLMCCTILSNLDKIQTQNALVTNIVCTLDFNVKTFDNNLGNVYALAYAWENIVCEFSSKLFFFHRTTGG